MAKKSTAKADSKTSKKTGNESVKESKASKKSSELKEIGDRVSLFATQGNLKRDWELREYAKQLGVDSARTIPHATALHQVQVELSLGKDKITIPSDGYLTITLN